MERDVSIRWLVLLGFPSRPASDRDHVPYELEDPDAVGAGPDRGFSRTVKRYKKGMRPPGHPGVRKLGFAELIVDSGAAGRGAEDVGVPDGLGRD